MSAARVVARLALALLGLLVAFAGVTWLALEESGVAVVWTHAPDGGLRTTHVWSVERDGATWLEAGKPENPWFADLRRDPRLAIESDGAKRDAVAEIVPDASPAVRAAMRARYGWRDRWVQLLVNANRATAVRLRFSAPPS